MKNLFLSALVLLISASMLAQKAKVINNPYYEFRNTGLNTISKIETSPEETRVYIHSTFIPNWWVDFSNEEKLIDCDTKKEYKIKEVVGVKFGQKVRMPSSSDSTFVLVFPPLDQTTQSFDFNDQIFGVSLDEGKAGLKPHNLTLPIEINEWLNKEVDKCKKEPLKDYNSRDFFLEEEGRIVGYIKGYSAKSGITTGMVYLSNYLTGEDYPIVVEIQPDGRFDVMLPLISPLYSSMKIGKTWIPFYLEPGLTLGMILNWEDFLYADRYRHINYKMWDTGFKGKLAKINQQLLDFEFEDRSYFKHREQQKKMTEDELAELYTRKKEMELAKVEYYIKAWRINADKVYPILKNKIILTHAQELYSLARQRKYIARQDTTNKELQKPLPDSFYNFLRDIPLGDHALFINTEFRSFVNAYEFSELITKHTRNIKIQPPVNVYQYLIDNEPLLSKEDKEYALLASKKGKTPEEIEQMKDMQLSYKVFSERYGSTIQKWQELASAHRYKAEVPTWDDAEKELAEKYNIENNLTLDVAKVRSLKYKFENVDKGVAEEFWQDLKEGIEHPYLIATGDKLFEKVYGDNANRAYELPEGTAAEIFNNIIKPHKGKILFVDFWATSCGPCVGGIKRMKETRKEYENSKEIDFVFITDEQSSPEKNYNEFIKDQELRNTYRISGNDYLYLRQLFKFNGIPRYVVIDKEGKVMDDNFRMYNFKTELDHIMKSRSDKLTKQ
ncbi:TlpA family protein disulfide reductase [Saccharicrinis sp. 156]|uniref:TlpA family protein disulfide reductase n=1 Tax=Saccharicrinis sp. 156 TaxID=3417574 RepID=UPI003D342E10